MDFIVQILLRLVYLADWFLCWLDSCCYCWLLENL